MEQREHMRPFTDEGKDWFINLLKTNGFGDVRPAGNKFSAYDVIGDKKGELFAFELVSRDVTSTTYDSILLDEKKYIKLKKIPYHSILVVFFIDKFYLINLKTRRPDSITTQLCKKTTKFANTDYVKKVVVKFDINKLKSVSYTK